MPKKCDDVRCNLHIDVSEEFCYGHSKVRDGLIEEYWEPADKKMHQLTVQK